MKNKEEGSNLISNIIQVIKVICAIFLIIMILLLSVQRFSDNEIAIGGFRVFSVATGSMVPKYKVGDLLIIKEVDTNELKEGDDVSYLGEVGTFKGKVVTHRIVRIEDKDGQRIFTTRGIANTEDDPQIRGDQIYGKVIYKFIVVSLLMKLMNNMVAFFFVIFIPTGILIFLQIKDHMNEKKERRKRKVKEYKDEEDDDDDYEEDDDEEDDDDDDYDEEDDDDDDEDEDD